MKTTPILIATFFTLLLSGCSKPDPVAPHNQYQQQLDASDRAHRKLERQ